MFEDVIIEQNFHWTLQTIELGVRRTYFDKITQYLKTGMIISITGVRRAGKSTLLKQVIDYLIKEQQVSPKNILFLNLEHPYFASYSKDISYLQKIYEDYLKLANPQGKIYCLLDEIQFFSEWPIFVKSLYEQKKVQFIVTGSNSAFLSSELMTLLSGRTLPIEVFPLSFAEIAQAYTIETSDPITVSQQRARLRNLVTQVLQYGAFPEVALNLVPSVTYDILSAYAKTILYQDVTPRLQLRKPTELERLFVYLISNVGKPFSYTNLEELFDITDKVIKEYIAAFADSYLLFELEAFDFSLKKQIRSQKKIYSIDTGQINALAFHFTQNIGRLLENLVFLELRRMELEMYYYKTRENLEVDFLAKRNMQLALVQVALHIDNPVTLKRETKALVAAMHELNLTHGTLVTEDHAEQIITDEKQITVIPAYQFFCLSHEDKIKLLQLV